MENIGNNTHYYYQLDCEIYLFIYLYSMGLGEYELGATIKY